MSADPGAASTRIDALAKTCDGFSRALDMLSHGAFHGRVLIGLVDQASSAAATCAITGDGIAQRLARARRADEHPAEALAALAPDREPALRIRRAELLDRLGRTAEALRELDGIDEAPARRLYAVSVAAREGRFREAARMISEAPIEERPALAYRAVADAPAASVDDLALGPELATRVGDRLEAAQGPAAALAARERAVRDAPELAENHDALARAQIAAGKIDDALASWDRAAAIAPAQPAYRLAPIQALVIAGESQRASLRANSLAVLAGSRTNDVELLVTASAGAAAAGNSHLASELARTALDARPGDGRLVFLFAGREAEADRTASAVELYAELLVCGAHGRPWHRHEVSAKLAALDRKLVIAALDAPRKCATADAADLAGYVEAIRKQVHDVPGYDRGE